MICNCGNAIPDVRVNMGYNFCVECSDIELLTPIDITYHKTGNTIEALPASLANAINKKTKRKGFGIMAGMQSNESGSYNPKNTKYKPSNNVIGNDVLYEEVGVEMMEIYDTLDYDEAYRFICNQKNQLFISSTQFNKLNNILKQLQNLKNA